MRGESRFSASSFPPLNGKEPEAGPGDYRREIEVDGATRFYDLHVPPSCVGSAPAPLVLNFHGGCGNPVQQRADSCMDPVADAKGFIVAYTAGTSLFGTFLTWNVGLSHTYAGQNDIDDVGYARAVLSDVSTFLNIDATRVYATGLSQGGMFCYRLACEMSDKIAAIAPVAAVMHVPECDRKPVRPMPIIHFHGLRDQNVLYDGGPGRTPLGVVERPGVKETIEWWVSHNGLPPEPTREGGTGHATFKQFGSDVCEGEVMLWTLADGGHTWPGGESVLPEERVGAVNRDISASDLMGEFFNRHALV